MKCKDCNACKKGFFKSKPNEYVCTGVKEPFVINNIENICTEYPKRNSEMWKVELPYKIGTYVKVLNDDGELEYCGSVAAYTVDDKEYTIWVAGYKQPISGEFLPQNIVPMTKEEIEEMCK